MSDTPRTDAAIEAARQGQWTTCVDADVARKLERENAELSIELAEAKLELAAIHEDNQHAAEIMARIGVSPEMENSLEKLMLHIECMVGALRKDKERLDWLENHLSYAMVIPPGHVAMQLLANNGCGWSNGELRKAIDAAHASQQPVETMNKSTNGDPSRQTIAVAALRKEFGR